MDHSNSELQSADDTVDPAAKDEKKSPISGMPSINDQR